MFAVVYIRVSTEDQARYGYSLEGQEQVCYKKAKELGAVRVEKFLDVGVTGEILERPGLQAALSAVRAGARWFIAYDPDRLSRKLSHQLFLAETIEKTGCQLEFVNFEWQNTPEGRLFFSLRGAIAEYEKEKFKIRSMFGKRTKAKRGLLTHSPHLFGYRYKDGRLYVDSGQAIIYRRMVEMVLEGLSPERIAQVFNKQGIPAPKGRHWYRGTIRRILKNPTYTGMIYLNRYNTEGIKAARQRGEQRSPTLRSDNEWIAVPITPMVTKEEWEKVQNTLKKNKRGRRGQTVNYYLLSSLLYCGKCGSSVHGNFNNGYRYYVCAKRHVSGYDYKKVPVRCDSSFLRADQVEDIVWNKVKEWLSDPEGILQAADLRVSKNSAIEGEIKILVNRSIELDDERERIFLAYRRGKISLDDFDRAVSEVAREKEGVEKRLNELESKLSSEVDAARSVELLKEIADRVADKLDDLDDADRREVIRAVIQRITVHDTELILDVKIPLTDTVCVME